MPKPARHETARINHAEEISQDSLTELRQEICDILEESLTTCEISAWFDWYAPSCRVKWDDDFLERVERKMRETGRLSDSGWSAVLTATEDHETEASNTFKYMADIAAGVAEEAMEINSEVGPTAIIKPTPDNVGSISEVDAFKFKPDIRAVLPFPNERLDPRFIRCSGRICKQKNTPEYKEGERLSSINTSDTVVVGAVKKGGEAADVRDNELELCGGATELLYNDPCRRFVNGFTIEGSFMRVWRFERSHACVSSDFNFHKEPRLFILFLLYLTFSPHMDLGFDPTVVRYTARVPKEGIQNADPKNPSHYEIVISYRYQVQDKYYLTIGHPISESSAWSIASRSTRVWLVREIFFGKDGEFEEGKETFILKDAYPYDDAVLEKDIKDNIIQQLSKLDKQQTPPTNYAKKAEAYFMTYVYDELVKLPDENESMWSLDDLTTYTPVTEPICFTPVEKVDSLASVEDGDVIVFVARESQRSSTCPESQRQAIRDAQKPNPKVARQQKELNYHRRKHVRTIHKEVCQSIYELPDWHTLIRCLIDIIEGLNLLRLAGWVHRDISGGNCLWHMDGERGKIADLEYAMPYDRSGEHVDELMTGTPEFMAAEYQDREYFHNVEVADQSELEEVPFTFNFYHDLEPIFWIYAWSLFYRPPSQCFVDIGIPMPVIEQLKRSAKKWFDCSIGGNNSRLVTIQGARRAGMTSSLRGVYTPETSCSVLLGGLEVVKPLSTAYRDLEGTPLQLITDQHTRWRPAQFSEVPYREMQNKLRHVLDALNDHELDVYVRPLSDKNTHPRDAIDDGHKDDDGPLAEKRAKIQVHAQVSQ
ncbi:hypothetical protein CONPUDRAFT_165309 [Coniophora puteana RWD-64-598 SS2]|uniref:Fungal-type protein kinase domain-containing protein n=1 Tax=Coniophora puteana (strain RWD-64-598) TaxID=741705 RepID=A0A5M3MPU8_CONPW|nr:uncharacterized protein CONPUDRAFT_165309 [Coniophora puteana RWD-64-598 SS2]EIW81087.1 hypothetical protein CONPUDRAFT_165309 [Coniophora puteana RWD-64-598 SS2]